MVGIVDHAEQWDWGDRIILTAPTTGRYVTSSTDGRREHLGLDSVLPTGQDGPTLKWLLIWVISTNQASYGTNTVWFERICVFR